MRIKDFQKQFEVTAPVTIAWKGDNVGLLVGRENDKIQNIVVALDLTMDVAKEAKRKKANVIITHHPLLFHPVKVGFGSSQTTTAPFLLNPTGRNNFMLAKKLRCRREGSSTGLEEGGE